METGKGRLAFEVIQSGKPELAVVAIYVSAAIVSMQHGCKKKC